MNSIGPHLAHLCNLNQQQEVGQFEPTYYPPETSAMKLVTKRWISAGGRL